MNPLQRILLAVSGVCLSITLSACNTIDLSAERTYVPRAESPPPSIWSSEASPEVQAEANIARKAEGHIVHIRNNGKKTALIENVTLFLDNGNATKLLDVSSAGLALPRGARISLPVPGSMTEKHACIMPSYLTLTVTVKKKQEMLRLPIGGVVGSQQFRDMREEGCLR